MKLILASRSPRRKQLLEGLGYQFECIPACKDEVLRRDLPLDQAIGEIALSKAREVAAGHPDDLILAADTLVVLDGEILGKPENEEDAIRMLERLSGKKHEVKTGIAFHLPDREVCRTVTTEVFFRPLSPDEIQAYAKSGKPLDKAGAYGIQETDFAGRIEGSYSNVVGLPIQVISRMLQGFENDPKYSF